MKQNQKIHGEQSESSECDLVLGLIIEGLPARQYSFLYEHSRPYLALEQISNLLLNALCLSQQAFLHCQSLEATFAATYVVDFGGAILDSSAK